MNAGDYSKGHIGSEGALRFGKGIWWMSARMAGWNGCAAVVNELVKSNKTTTSSQVFNDEIKVALDYAFLIAQTCLQVFILFFCLIQRFLQPIK